MKKKFVRPEMEKIELCLDDIITTSFNLNDQIIEEEPDETEGF